MTTSPTIRSVKEVVRALKTVVDPEIGVNLVDLGMIYDIHWEGNVVHISMTLTNARCPMHEILMGGIQNAVRNLEGVESCVIQLVWSPPWDPAMISDEGRRQMQFPDFSTASLSR